jgi:hypothetical protein
MSFPARAGRLTRILDISTHSHDSCQIAIRMRHVNRIQRWCHIAEARFVSIDQRDPRAAGTSS